MKKLIKYILIALFLFIPAVHAEEKVNLYLFYGEGCSHCAREKEFLNKIKDKYPQLEIHEYETWYSNENSTLLTRVKNGLGVDSPYVPFTVIGETGYTGFNENIGYQIEEKIKKNTEEDLVSKVLENPAEYDTFKDKHIEESKKEEKPKDEKVVVPILGKVDAKKVSLPILAVVIGLVDGFNPCAMWVLLFLISMLLGMKNRKRMWALGLTFLASSAFIYLLFMVSWLTVALSVSSIGIVRMIIAFVALGAGIINLLKYFKKEDDGCDIVDDKKRKKVFSRIKKFTTEKSLLLSLLGMIALAFSVNLVELACSAGLPLLFTQVLAMNDLSTFQYGLYIFLYILFFLLDDLVVFGIAMFSLKMTGFSNKYSKYSHLVGGIIMVIIGILLFFKPELLMFQI